MRPLLAALCALALACSDGPGPAPVSSATETRLDAHRYLDSAGLLRVALVKQPYHGERNVAELSRNPEYLEEGGITGTLSDGGSVVMPVATVALTEAESREYGEWHRLGLANGHLADFVAENEKAGSLTVGLLANCNALLGMLGGFQTSGPPGSLRTVGLVWIDAHGDFNTPETTLSGMLGGMPVAVSAGLALNRLRRESHLEIPIATGNIVMVSVRDTDPEEQALIEANGLAQISTQDIQDRSGVLQERMARLSEAVDLIYVHVDMDVLDPSEVPGHGLNVPGGPTSEELSAALAEIFTYPRVAGLGIASTPAYEADPDGRSRRAAYRLIQGAVAGVRRR